MTGPGDRVETMVPRLLLSARTRDALADAIAAARGGQALDILTLEDAESIQNTVETADMLE